MAVSNAEETARLKIGVKIDNYVKLTAIFQSEMLVFLHGDR